MDSFIYTTRCAQYFKYIDNYNIVIRDIKEMYRKEWSTEERLLAQMGKGRGNRKGK